MRTIEERAQALGMDMADVESACCRLVAMMDGIENPRQTMRDYYKSINHPNYEDFEISTPEGWNEPMWKIKMYHFVTFCEMYETMNGRLGGRAVLD